MKTNRPVLIIDSLNLFTRHFIANPTISINGEHVGGIVGFLKAIQLLCERFKPGKIFVIWEGGGSPRRRSLQSDYKNLSRPKRLNRYYEDDIPDTKENRNWQIASLIRFLKNSGIKQFYVSDCEADDVIGYLCQDILAGQDKIVVSSDKDLYQLISSDTKQWSPGQKKMIDSKAVFEKFGVYPENFCLVRSFVGDSSDNLRGIKGAGFKSVVKRFPEINSEKLLISDLIKLAEEKSQTSKLKLYKEIAENPDIPERNWKLMSLGYRNLSGQQILKVNSILAQKNSPKNKLEFFREKNRVGINNFDVERYFLSIRNLDNEPI